ncbi:hypothetical protein L873DRAFT_1799327 [Choiromyces venosus 120613-1]|uniref:Uncharacterized protein n=1 Tax=Choiromyces venosus 120613-1 TaxID=1336337 RepID=A0A3N4K7M3_9PEZI|nr:hypothetical protein L873DRAFT_1799327 [Choiromyces venosus 120613-1]
MARIPCLSLSLSSCSSSSSRYDTPLPPPPKHEADPQVTKSSSDLPWTHYSLSYCTVQLVLVIF